MYFELFLETEKKKISFGELVRRHYEKGNLYTFSGKKDDFGVFRQSPHEPTDHIIDIPKEAVPMVGLEVNGDWTILFSDTPAVYDNYTTQTICPEKAYFELSSGDGGAVSGGSYYLYEMLFHIDAYIHGILEAEENMIWRSSLDFRIGGTYFEHVNTVTGNGNKPNQGWNCCVYPIWQSLIDRKLADDKFFREMDKLL